MSDKYTDPKLPFYTDKCKCSACNEYFNSTAAFDGHRRGKAGIDRRCLTPDELLAKGFQVNRTGHWITSARLPGADLGNETLREGA